jgi:hypothetical protein
MTTHSLTGRSELNITNLKGKHTTGKTPIYDKITLVKEKILEDYLMPVFTNQMFKLYENAYFIDKIQKKIQDFYDTYKLDELTVYIELLKIIKIMIQNYRTIDEYEQKINAKKMQANDVVSMIFKTSQIRLLPEYELYDSILGKPKKALKEKYDMDIIAVIKQKLSEENISYKKIKEYIHKIYEVTF